MASAVTPGTLIVDTSGVVALYDASAKAHKGALVCVRNAALRLIPSAILAEIDYMLAARLAPQAARDFLSAVESGFFMVEPFTREDAGYCGALMDRYQSLKLGLADTAVMAVAERHHTPDVLSLDNRHFGVVKPAAFAAFKLWPPAPVARNRPPK
ncbi:MAG: hypothetical protein A3H35_11060 [Betaproteobacteria bacterium RIFCSPLOWO2_02_FULL_62_17]|nr:MAG: hypothetical protein A3H35_11060 [Betaproteobacteria bacterium RIFCSPLOWO2_02_FULL_62_17]